MRTVMFGDGGWASRTLLRLRETGHDTAAVVLRVRPSDDTLEAAAHACGIPVLQPRDVNAPEFVARMRDLGADVHLSIAYNQIFRTAIRDTAAWFLNVHAGKLPRYRGRNVINWALINGEPEIGITVHLVDDGIDTGAILLQRSVPITPTATYGEVLEHIHAAIPDLVVESFAKITRGDAAPRPQFHENATYCPGRAAGDEWLDWTDTSCALHNKIRALTHPGPGARTLLDRDEITIWRATYDPYWPRYVATPGAVVGRQADGVLVKTRDSTILLQEVQVNGGPPHVPRWPMGTRLGFDVLHTLHSLMRRVDELERALAQQTLVQREQVTP